MRVANNFSTTWSELLSSSAILPPTGLILSRTDHFLRDIIFVAGVVGDRVCEEREWIARFYDFYLLFMKKTKQILSVMWSEIMMQHIHDEDFLSLTDIARFKNELEPNQVIRNRLRNKNTIDFLWLRERLYNKDFKPVEFDGFRNKAGENAFTLSPKAWIEWVDAIWMTSKSGRYWWTYAHKDIALEFASWISVEVKLYLVKDYQRLKEEENTSVERSVRRLISKTNYKIHTDAIKENLIPKSLTAQQISYIYADEADMLNVALFGVTAKQRREKNPDIDGNVRDQASIEQLIVLSNMESVNAELIRQELLPSQRIEILNQSAIHQLKSLASLDDLKKLG